MPYPREVINKYTREGYWESTTLSDLWERNSKTFPSREAICDSKTRLTWAQANQWINRLALGLVESGIKRDELIVLQLPNIVELWLLRVACEKAGIVNICAGRYLRHNEMEHILKYVGAAGIVIPWQFAGFDYYDMIQQLRPKLPSLRYIFVAGEQVPEGTISISKMTQQPLEEKYPTDYLEGRRFKSTDVSFLSHTSGTTGMPKIVEHAAASALCHGRMGVKIQKFTSDDIVAALSPAARGPNMPAFVYAPLVGAKTVMLERFKPEEALRLIERERVTVIGVVPTMMAQIMSQPNLSKYDLSSLRLIWSTGAPLLYQPAVDAEEKMGCTVVQVYCASDVGCLSSSSVDDSREVRLFTNGKHTAGGVNKVVDDDGNQVPQGEVAEVWMSGPCGHPGYYNDIESTRQAWTEDRWYKTGDLGKFDEQGNLWIVGRKKYMIIRGGFNIYPAEIEDKLITHPNVSDAGIIGMPDQVMGETICAYVVPKLGKRFTYDAMVSFLKQKGLAQAKIPERLEIVDKLPTVADGQKLDRKELEKDLREKLKAEGKYIG